jgi:branched-chain amino acid transport system permease protein
VRTWVFLLICLLFAGALFAGARFIGNDYVFFAGYTVLQFIVLATAWNILGGYTGYVNFGSAAFFALGAYSTVALYKFDSIIDSYLSGPFAAVMHALFPMPVPVLMVIGGGVSGLVGLGMGYLTLRLRGAFYSIATLALAVVLQTLIVNWNFVGGARGAYVIRPETAPIVGNYVHYLFALMLVLAVVAITTARAIERSRLGYGFASIRDDEVAAEACGVPTLRLKLIATTLSGALMGMAGAPFPYFIGYLQPASAFALDYAVNSIAMPMIGGTTTWVGPLIGAILLGTLQQVATVTISSAVNLLIVGLLIVDCVIVAPNGIVGLVRGRRISSAALAEPAVFAFLYAINAIPIYFLLHEQSAAAPLAALFWAILTALTLLRGRMVDRRWLAAFPVVAAAFSVVPGPAWLDVGSALLAAAGLAGGSLPARRRAERPIPNGAP